MTWPPARPGSGSSPPPAADRPRTDGAGPYGGPTSCTESPCRRRGRRETEFAWLNFLFLSRCAEQAARLVASGKRVRHYLALGVDRHPDQNDKRGAAQPLQRVDHRRLLDVDRQDGDDAHGSGADEDEPVPRLLQELGCR